MLAIAVSLFGALITAAGIFAVRAKAQTARRHEGWFVAFAAGILIAVPLLHLVPESIERSGSAPAGLLGGYLLFYLLGRFVAARVCGDPHEAPRALGLIAVAGIGLHSFLDGMVLAVGFGAGDETGLLTAAGLVLHEFPEGIVTYTLLLFSGMTERRALLLALAAAAVTTPLGTMVAVPIVAALDPPTLGLMLAVSAGALLYLGATHLLPHAEREKGHYSLAAVFGGVAVAVLVTIVNH